MPATTYHFRHRHRGLQYLYALGVERTEITALLALVERTGYIEFPVITERDGSPGKGVLLLLWNEGDLPVYDIVYPYVEEPVTLG